MIVDTEELAKGVLAYTEYQIAMPDGNEARLAFTFGDLTSDSIPTKYARTQGALAYGLLFIADLPDAPEFPLLWTQEQRFVAVTGAEGDRELTGTLQRSLLWLYDGVMRPEPEAAEGAALSSSREEMP
jgi:hypothetical protein